MSDKIRQGVDPLPSTSSKLLNGKYSLVNGSIVALLIVALIVFICVMVCDAKKGTRDKFEAGPVEWNMGPLYPEVFADSGYEGLRQYELADPGAYPANQYGVKDNPSENLLWAQMHMI